MSIDRNAIVVSAIITLVAIFVTAPSALWAASDKDKIAKEKAEIRQMTGETLSRLYKVQPSARKAVADAAGYAVFSNFGTKILVVGGGGGKGIVFDNQKKTETFMKMVEAQAGIGFGIKKFRVVWVFENARDVNDFVNSGWEFGGQTTAAAKLKDEGGQLCRRHVGVAGCLDLPAHRRRPGLGTHGQGHQILQGRRSELGAMMRRSQKGCIAE